MPAKNPSKNDFKPAVAQENENDSQDKLVTWKVFFVVALICGLFGFMLYYVVVKDYLTYHTMKKECANNSDICFCSEGECIFKSQCSTKTVDGKLLSDSCVTLNARYCEICKKAKYAQCIWEYCK